MLNWSVSRRYLLVNPVAGYKKPTRDDAILAPPSPAEVRRIWENASPHLRRALLLAYYTGARPGLSELNRLTWDLVDFGRLTITILGAAKGGPRVRILPLHKELADHLAVWHKDDGKPESGPIIHYAGKRIGSLKTAWKNAKKRAGVTRRMRLYDLRHAAITAMVREGDLKTVSQMAGHSREDTTIRVYAHTDLGTARALVGRVPGLGVGDNNQENKKSENIDTQSPQTQKGM